MIVELDERDLRDVPRRSERMPAGVAVLDIGLRDSDIAQLRAMLEELENRPSGRAHGVRKDFARDPLDVVPQLHLWRTDPDVERPISDRFDAQDLAAIGRCLTAMVEGPFIDHDGEFSTVMGVSREELRSIADRWPDLPLTSLVFRGVNGTLNNLLGYPHRQEHALAEMTGLDRQDIARLLAIWRGSPPESYFDALM